MDKKSSLEETLKKLETMVKKLETGDAPLQQAIEDFEKSVSLYKECKSFLESAEKKISILTEELKEVEYKA